MITGSQTALEYLQHQDDLASGLPSPSSKFRGGSWVNVCWNCDGAVEGPATRYRCPSCGKTADDDPHGSEQHVCAIEDGAYPSTESALILVADAKAKAPEDRTAIEQELSECTVTE